jgi:hypothetical protein
VEQLKYQRLLNQQEGLKKYQSIRVVNTTNQRYSFMQVQT